MRLCLLLLSVLTAAACLAGCQSGAFLIQPVPGRYSLEETVIQKDAGPFVKDKIAVIDLDGVIMNQARGGLLRSGDNPVSVFCEKLDRAAADKQVKAVLVRINSPGGSVCGTEIIYHKLMAFKRKKNVPVVAAMVDVAASGGYYLACACDTIYATPSTLTGSIGTIMQTFSIEKTLGFIGVQPYTIKSGRMKDMASPFHDMRDDEKAMLQDIIDASYQRFFDVVARRRGIPADTLKTIADGRVVTGAQALEYKLIDKLGYPQDALEDLRRQAGLGKCRVVMYHYPYQRMANLYDTAMTRSPNQAPAAVTIDLPDWLRSDTPRLLYLWTQ